MEGEQKSKAEKPANKDPYFHSIFIDKTKASEKKEYFTNIKEESKAKKIFSKISPTNSKKEKEKFDLKKWLKNPSTKKTIKRIAIIFIAALLCLGSIKAVIIFSETESSAIRAIEKNPESGISAFENLIFKTSQKEEKANLYLERASLLDNYYSSLYSQKILQDAYKAESLFPTKLTADAIYEYEYKYGAKAKAEEYRQIAEERTDYSFSEEDKD